MASSALGQNIVEAAKAGNLADIKHLIEKGADINEKMDHSGATALSWAASEGHKRVVSFLLSRKADIHIPTHRGYTPLMAAASQGWNDIASLLIARGADVNAKSENGFTAVMMAVWGGHAETAELLVQHGADINAAPYMGICALMVAIKAGNQHIIPTLMRLGANPNQSFERTPIPPLFRMGGGREYGSLESNRPLLKGHKDIFNLFFRPHYRNLLTGQTPLTAAASRGWLEIVALLIANGADVNIPNRVGLSALMAAARSGNPKVVKVFVDNGSDVNGVDCQGNTPLSLASASGNLASVNLLISAGADLNPMKKGIPENWDNVCPRGLKPRPIKNPLLAAAKSGNSEVVKIFVDNGLDVNGVDCLGNTPLSLASASDDLASVKLLISAGADLNPQKKAVSEVHKAERPCSSRIKKAQNPLRQVFAKHVRDSAKIRDCEMVAIYLLQHGASIEPEEIDVRKSQEPFLTMALSKGMLKLGKYLIDKGANVNARYKNDTLLYYFANNFLSQEKFPVSDTVRLLCESGADVEYRDRWGRTLLMVMANADQLEILKLLLTYGADVNALNTSETNPRRPATALGYAIDGGYLSVIKFLLEKGADVNGAVEKGAAPLWFAVSHNNPEIVQLLLDRGAHVNTEWQNPLRCCLLKKNIEMAQLLLAHGANMRSRCLDGMLVDFISKKELEIVMFMINNGADLNAISKNSKDTPLMAAILSDLPELAALLINSGADVNATDNKGNTPLMLAARKGDLQTSKVLLQHGANAKTRTPDGYTAYIIAVNKGHQSIANLLKNHGGKTVAAVKYFATLRILNKLSNKKKNGDVEPPSPAELDYYISILSSKLGIKNFLSWKPDPIFGSPEKTWAVYKKALRTNDLNLALECHAADTKNKYKEILTALGPDKVKDLVKEMGPIEKISGDMNSAKYRLMGKQNGKMTTYVVYFSNYLGEWKIEFY